MTIVEEQIIIVTPLAKIRRKGVTIRTYKDTDNFVNVAPWTAVDFADCGEQSVMYFKEQAGFPYIAIHGDHVHVLAWDRNTGQLADFTKNEARDIVNKFKGFLKGKSIEIKE